MSKPEYILQKSACTPAMMDAHITPALEKSACTPAMMDTHITPALYSDVTNTSSTAATREGQLSNNPQKFQQGAMFIETPHDTLVPKCVATENNSTKIHLTEETPKKNLKLGCSHLADKILPSSAPYVKKLSQLKKHHAFLKKM